MIQAIESRFSEVRVELEPNREFLLRPTMLLLFDRALMDPGDYAKIEASRSKSPWHRLTYENAHFLIEEGSIELRPAPLNDVERSQIRANGELFGQHLPIQLKAILLQRAWASFYDYLSVKTHYMRSEHNLFAEHVQLRGQVRGTLKRYEEEPEVLHDEDIAILRHCFWKAQASLAVAVKEGAPLHVADEYRPFVSYLINQLSRRGGDQARLDYFRLDTIDKLLVYIAEFSLPKTSLENDAERRDFIRLRAKTWSSFKLLCKQIDDLIYDTNSQTPLEDAREFLSNQFQVANADVVRWSKQEYKDSRVVAHILKAILHVINFPDSIVDDIFGAPWDGNGLPPASAIGSSVRERYPWYYAAAECFEASELVDIRAELDREPTSDVGGALTDYWFKDPSRMPWYVRGSMGD